MVEKLICLHNEIQLVTKINTFFIVFHFDDDEHGGGGLKIKKSKIASKFWYIYGSVTFFFFLSYQVFSFFHCVPSASLEESAQIERGASIRPPARLSVCLSVLSVRPSILFIPASGPAVSGAFLLPVPVSCFLSVGGRGRSRKREQYAGQAGTVIWLCTHSWSVHGFQQTAALFPKV